MSSDSLYTTFFSLGGGKPGPEEKDASDGPLPSEVVSNTEDSSSRPDNRSREAHRDLPSEGRRPFNSWSAKVGDAAIATFVAHIFQQVAAFVPGSWRGLMTKGFDGVRRGLSPFAFGPANLERAFADYQAAAALPVSTCFYWMALLLLMVVMFVTSRQPDAADLLPGLFMVAEMSIFILLVSTYLPQTYKLFRFAFSTAYIAIYIATLVYWRNAMVKLKSAELALLHPALALAHVSSHLIVVHLLLMLGIPLPMHIHVPLHTFILMRHTRDHMPLCGDVTWLPAATASPAAFILGTLTPAVWEMFTGLSLPGLDLIWATPSTFTEPNAVHGVGWGAHGVMRFRGQGSGVWLGPAPVASCSAVLSGGWLVALELGTLFLGGLEIAQRRTFLMQLQPAPRTHLENWP